MISKIIGTMLASALLLNSHVLHAANDEIQIDGDVTMIENRDTHKLPNVSSCELKPPKNGCSVRLVCTGVATIMGKQSYSVDAALKMAKMQSKAAFSEFIKDKAKTDSEMKYLYKVYAKDATSQEQIGNSLKQTITSNAEATFAGFEFVGSEVNMEKAKVWVAMGRRCEGAAAAKAIESDSPSSFGSGNESSNDSSNNGTSQGLPGKPSSEKQMRNDF